MKLNEIILKFLEKHDVYTRKLFSLYIAAKAVVNTKKDALGMHT